MLKTSMAGMGLDKLASSHPLFRQFIYLFIYLLYLKGYAISCTYGCFCFYSVCLTDKYV